MADRCFKCKKELKQDDFICPQCGAIIGDPISYAFNMKQSYKRTNRFRIPWRRIFVILILLSLTVAVAVGASCILGHQKSVDIKDENPLETAPEPTVTTAPLTTYMVSIRSENKTDLSGSSIHIYNGEEKIYTSQVGEDGSAFFILPEGEGYSVRLSSLPVQYQVNYGDEVFYFEEGQRTLGIVLLELPVRYSVKAVDSSGNPVAGVGIYFYSTGEDEQLGVTDESGICFFETAYSEGAHSASISFVPNGFALNNERILFMKNTLESEIVLQTNEEAGYDPENIYTIRVVDDYGEPLSSVRLSVAGMFVNNSGLGIWVSGTTNLDGCFSFHNAGSLRCKVTILDHVDYRDVPFEFEADQHEMQIQLDLVKEPGEKYTYTVKFVHSASDTGIPGVQIAVRDESDSSDEVEYYTSDEQGVITFESTQSDPMKLYFNVEFCPDSYTTVLPEYHWYYFQSYSRNLTVLMKYDGLVAYRVFLQDAFGSPVSNAELTLYLDKDGNKLCFVTTNLRGFGTFRLSPDYELKVEKVILGWIPDEYQEYVVEHIEYGEDRDIYITIASIIPVVS